MKENEIPIKLPFMGEFGSKISKDVPGVYGIPRPLIIIHEAGEEALYPNATERHIYERPSAIERSAGGNKFQVKFKETAKLKWPEGKIPYMEQFKAHFEPQVWEDHIKTGQPPQWQRTYIEPTASFKMAKSFFVPQYTKDYDCDFDVLLFARRQRYAYGRNFNWEPFYEGLKAEGIKCLIAGQPDSTAQLGCPAIWDLVDKPSEILDATLWAISKARFRIGSATGTTLLSMLCGKPPIMIISDSGFDSQGSKQTFPAGYYYATDHTKCGWKVIAHWMTIDKAIAEFLEMYQDQDKFEAECKGWIKAIDHNLTLPDPKQLWPQVK